MRKTYLHNLTSLRGIAAILVAVLHFHFFLGPVMPYGESHFIDKFYLMVDLFFILSGFIMCYVYGDVFSTKIKKSNYKNFLIARLARIYPLHMLTLLAEILIFLFILSIGKFDFLSPPIQHLYRLDAIPIQLLFLQTIGIYNFDTFNAPAWSLSAEWWALNTNKATLDVNWHYGTLRGIVGFIAGMAIWHMFERNILKSFIGNGWILLAFVIVSFLSMQFSLYDSFTVFLFSLIILSSAYGSKNINKFYSLQLFRKLGDWSFSIYIWHMVFIHVITTYFLYYRTEPITGLMRPLKDGHPIILSLTAFLLTTCVLGFLSYKYIETPTRKWIKDKYG